jgi:16S rRNA (uracil1498-N3)-methyltransferase
VSAPLFLLDRLPDGDLVELAGAEGLHAATVRRLTVGEPISVGDGRGTVCLGEVVEVGRERLVARCAARSSVPRPDPRLVVVQALAKGDRAERAVELMTELGVDEIVPWAAARSIVQWHGERTERSRQRWMATAREAAKQSRRAWLPEVAAAADTAQVVARAGGASLALVLHPSAAKSVTEVDLPGTGEIVVVVGPEGGIDDAEIDRFRSAGATVVRMGPAILRASTAGAAACAGLSARLGRWA